MSHRFFEVFRSGTLEIFGVTVGPLQENCYLVVDTSTGDAVVVDPGDEPDLIASLAEFRQARLSAIWLTHAHVDHVGAVGPLAAQFGVPVYLHKADLALYQHAATTGRMYGMFFEQPPDPSNFYDDGDEVACGSVRFEVLHLPGHSPGHVILSTTGVCLSGDVLFAGSIGRTDLPLSDPRAMLSSLERIASLPSGTVVLPGHGPDTSIGREKQSNPFLRGVARPPGA